AGSSGDRHLERSDPAIKSRKLLELHERGGARGRGVVVLNRSARADQGSHVPGARQQGGSIPSSTSGKNSTQCATAHCVERSLWLPRTPPRRRGASRSRTRSAEEWKPRPWSTRPRTATPGPSTC